MALVEWWEGGWVVEGLIYLIGGGGLCLIGDNRPFSHCYLP